MFRKLMLVSMMCVSGCTLTSGVYIEKDWKPFSDPHEFQTSAKIEIKREF